MGKFRVDLRLLSELGERLISRDEVAVVELVKNSYDADARIVEVRIDENRIEVIDDGEGMGEHEINAGWLTIGTVIKKQRKRAKSSSLHPRKTPTMAASVTSPSPIASRLKRNLPR